MLAEAALQNLRAGLRGVALAPSDAGYDEVRLLHNGMFVRSPALIVRCLGTADVIDAVRFALAHDLELAVRGGGHSVAGKSVCEGGLMLDLSLMKGIHVDPAGRTVRAQGGVTWGELDRETQLYGLATTGGTVSTTGIAGLTLGGGLGWLMGKHGLAADNLIGAELVSAAGEVVRASAAENPELLWGLRGGGGNFGVVTWFEYRLHSVGPVTSGFVDHRVEGARDVLRFFREFTASAPDELSVHALLHTPDPAGPPRATILGCHCGSLADGEIATRPIKRYGSPTADTFGPASYSDTNTTLYDPAFPRGARNYWKSSFLAELSDAAIAAIVEQFAICPSPMSGILLEHCHGAATRVGAGETAFAHRRESYNLVVVSQWTEPKEDEPNIAWARTTYAALRPFLARESYSNYQSEDDGEGAPERVYGPNHARLVALKSRWDPTNLFRANQNIRPRA